MRKSFLLLFFAFLSTGMFAQKTSVASTPSLVNEQIKNALVTELQIGSDVAERVVLIEDEFFSQATAIKALKEPPIKEKAKMREITITRRTKLAAVPLTPRQMEDAMMIVENIRRKHGNK